MGEGVRGPARSGGGRPRGSRLTATGLVLVALCAALALAGSLLAPHDPAAIDPLQRLQGPSTSHPLGTDHLGRDVLSRLLVGASWSLGAAALSAALIALIGVTAGVVAGYYGGPCDAVLMGVVDLVLALPGLLLAFAIVGVLGPGLPSVLIALVGVGWAGYARLVRGLVVELRARPFVEAARCLGLPDRRILLHHVLPNLTGPVLVLASLDLGELILAISALSFLGLGVQPPTPEWGAMLNDGRAFFLTAPQLMIFPGVAISAAAIGFNLLGEGLRDRLDPRTRPIP